MAPRRLVEPLRERSLTKKDYAAAQVMPDMWGVFGFVIEGRHTAYAVRCDASANYHAGWWVCTAGIVATVRTEKQARALARRLAGES